MSNVIRLAEGLSLPWRELSAKYSSQGEIRGHLYRSEDGGPRLARSVLRFPNCHGVADHPTQKPVGLLQVLLRYSLPRHGLVLDPFMGSGSTLVAASLLGAPSVGIEVEEKQCEVAARRLDGLLFAADQAGFAAAEKPR